MDTTDTKETATAALLADDPRLTPEAIEHRRANSLVERDEHDGPSIIEEYCGLSLSHNMNLRRPAIFRLMLMMIGKGAIQHAIDEIQCNSLQRRVP
jgi:hypothetical protein